MTNEPATFESLFSRYLQHLEMLNYSSKTLTTQTVYGHRISEFLSEAKITDVQSITATTLTDLQRWIFYQPTVKGTARTIASQNRVMSSVKSFFAFLVAEGYLAHNPAQELRLSKEQIGRASCRERV